MRNLGVNGDKLSNFMEYFLGKFPNWTRIPGSSMQNNCSIIGKLALYEINNLNNKLFRLERP